MQKKTILEWPQLIQGKLLKRYKRFLADVQLENGKAVTARGLKHLKELQKLKKRKNRCVMFYLIQRMDAKTFTPEYDVDPDYGNELKKAEQNGVEILVYDVNINLHHISINNQIPYTL